MEESEKVEFFNKNELSLEYVRWGNGKKAMIALHGFGRSFDDFREFSVPFLNEYTVFGVNIFFHGKSTIGDRNVDWQPLRSSEFRSFFTSFIDHLDTEKVYLLGYSLGGRISFKIAELLPERVAGLLLFAPDGMITNRWYAMLSHYRMGRAVFRYFIKHNKAFYSTLHALNKYGVVSDKLKQFVEQETRNKERQWKVYKVWSFLRKTDPKLKQLSKSLKEYKIPVRIIIGKHDKIIPLKNSMKLKRVYPELEVFVVNSGHALLSHSVLIELQERNLIT